jgi:hypothetical protein
MPQLRLKCRGISEESCADIWKPCAKNAQQSSRVPGNGRSSREAILLGRWFFRFPPLSELDLSRLVEFRDCGWAERHWPDDVSHCVEQANLSHESHLSCVPVKRDQVAVGLTELPGIIKPRLGRAPKQPRAFFPTTLAPFRNGRTS